MKGTSWPVVDVDLRIHEPSDTGPIQFDVVTRDWSLRYVVEFVDGAMLFKASPQDAVIGSQRGQISLKEFFDKNGLSIFFEEHAVVTPSALLLKPDRTLPPFDRAALQALSWTGISLNVESQSPDRRADSVQARMIQHVMEVDDWSVVIDDDGTGEVADIVALRVDDDRLVVHLTHCKYVSGGQPRAQVADLYEVCGQAQKSVIWRRKCFEHD